MNSNFYLQVDPQKDHPHFHIMSYMAYWSTPVINPIIYISTQRRYRDAFIELLGQIRYNLSVWKPFGWLAKTDNSEELAWN